MAPSIEETRSSVGLLDYTIMVGCMNTQWRSVYQQEEAVLAEMGAALRGQQFPQIPVRIPRALAERAVTAWKREVEEGGTISKEAPEERTARHRAGTLALIGIAVDERGQRDGEDILVSLHPEQIGVALDATDIL